MRAIDKKKILEAVRDYQKEAIKLILKYISSSCNEQALIQMPTGAGKTGVMAAVSQMFTGVVMIITPSAYLPSQILNEIKTDFWTKIGIVGMPIKEIIWISTKNDFSKINLSKKQVIIITIQELAEIMKNPDKQLVNHVKLILFDEGHREFADIWKQIIELFQCKKVLFTATPYRNDKKIFSVSDKYTYRYDINAAISDRAICSPIFKALSENIVNRNNTDELVSFILQLCDQNHKILIRMDGSKDILILVNAINTARNHTAVGFHSDQSVKLCSEGKEISQKKTQFSVFIHSDMLIEGLDFPELDTLIFIDTFNNTKSFIQQVGRVLRNAENKDNALIFMFKDDLLIWEEQWKLYLEAGINRENIIYIDGRLKRKFVFNSDFYKVIRIPKRAKIFLSNKTTIEKHIENIKNKISERIDLKEMQEYVESMGDYRLFILCYEKTTSSRFLEMDYYIDKSLELTVILEIKSKDSYYTFYFDTCNFSLPIEKDSVKEVSSTQFHKLMPDNFDVRSSKYTLTSQRSLGTQTREQIGISLQTIPPDISQKLSYCRNISGIIDAGEKKKVKRYISPINSKITDDDMIDYLGYIDWCKDILNTWESSDEHKYFANRYSNIYSEPSTPPTSIILCLDVMVYKQGDRKYLPSQFLEITNNTFQLMIDGVNHQGKVEINQKYKIHISDIDDYIVCEESKSLSTYINEGNYRIYFAAEDIMFCNKYFFKPNIITSYLYAENWSLWSSILEINELSECEDEKTGDKSITTDNWPPKSVFRVIVDEIKSNYHDIEYIMCDDLNSEISDFIAVSPKNETCYFIHCKHHKKSFSASDFQDVCGQALKNIDYILKKNIDDLIYLGTHENRWYKEWNVGQLHIPRLIHCPEDESKTPDEKVDDFINKLKEVYISPYGKKEIWIVQSGLSKSTFRQQLEITEGKQKEQLAQLIWLLQSTQDTIVNAGAQLKIFCRP